MSTLLAAEVDLVGGATALRIEAVFWLIIVVNDFGDEFGFLFLV